MYAFDLRAVWCRTDKALDQCRANPFRLCPCLNSAADTTNNVLESIETLGSFEQWQQAAQQTPRCELRLVRPLAILSTW
jgi:hypothetical protein